MQSLSNANFNMDMASKAAPKPMVSRRRALGDITNATNDDAKDVVAKKPQFIAPSNADIMDTQDNASVATDRTYMNRMCDDIDARDSDNPLLVASCVNEIYENFSIIEKEFRVDDKYMMKQDYINEKMRSILVDWLVDVHLKFKMVPESLYMTVNIIDRYLAKKQVRRSRLQLVGVAALLIAAKYEEIYPPELRDLAYITDHAYNKQEILEMESEIVTTLDFYFTIPTTHAFLCRYLKAAHADRTMVQLACYLTERSLQEYSMLTFLPSTIAATAVYIARKSLKRHPWSPTLSKYSNYDEVDLTDCIEQLKSLLRNPNNNQQQAVAKKYSSTKFGSVAKLNLSF